MEKTEVSFKIRREINIEKLIMDMELSVDKEIINKLKWNKDLL